MAAIPGRRTAIMLAPLIAAMLLSACGTAAGVTSGEGASCGGPSSPAYLASARTAFIGVMLPGPTVSTGQGSVLASPARVRVVRYLKGTGPPVVTVVTAATEAGGGVAVAEDGIQPQAGQRWKIYATTQHPPYQTSICDGSALMGGTS